MLVEKKLVEVAFEVVLFSAVKFWSVVDPVRRRLERVVRPDTLSVVKVPAPEAETIQVPDIAKQPLVKVIPLAKVDVAVVEVTLSAVVWIPPAKVEVAPSPSIVVVDVRPMNMVSKAENAVDEALLPPPSTPQVNLPVVAL
jgi:hypothetical protein